jgi:hypothetical protein
MMYLRPCWVVDLSQVKMNVTTHGLDIVRLHKEAKKAAWVENLKLVDLIKELLLAQYVLNYRYI